MGIDFKQALTTGSFCLDLKSTTKEGVIREMIQHMAKDGTIPDVEAAYNSVIEREKRMSTGMQHGIAVPHGKTVTVENLTVALGIKPDGVDFHSLDGKPCRIFVMTISSTTQTGPHVQYLYEISRLLTRPAIRERLIKARTKADIVTILTA